MQIPNHISEVPDQHGHFGDFGGRYAPETLMPLLLELEEAFRQAWDDPAFHREFDNLQKNYIGRPSPLWYAERVSQALSGPKIYFKRDELNHSGSHKINNVIGQLLLAKRMGRKRIIAETGAGQHGVATAMGAALMGMECKVYMGQVDARRQAPNIARMRLLGADIVEVTAGTATLKDAMSEALREWVARVDDTYYVIGTVAGPHPYPMMVREFQSVIGREAKEQILTAEGRLPDLLLACVGGGSNAMGLFYPFLDDMTVDMVGVEPAGRGFATGEHAAPLSTGIPGVLHGNRTYLMQDQHGQILDTHSIAAGLDYPGVGPEHAWLKDQGRVRYESAEDDDAVRAFAFLARHEGILPALEPSHALAWLMDHAKNIGKNRIVVMNLCGRGDKDITTILDNMPELAS